MLRESACESAIFPVGSGCHKTVLESFASWTNIDVMSRDQPDVVLHVLLQSRDTKTASDWAKLYNVSEELQKKLNEAYLCECLTAWTTKWNEAEAVRKCHL